MRGALVSALLGVLLAAPVAAQIAGSGQRTDSDKHWYTVKEPEPAPAPEAAPAAERQAEAPVRMIRRSVRIVPARTALPRPGGGLSGALAGGYRASPMLKLDVQVAARMGRTSGVRIISGGEVRVVDPVTRLVVSGSDYAAPEPQMKLIRVGSGPDVVLTSYGAELAGTRRAERPRPGTIRINP